MFGKFYWKSFETSSFLNNFWKFAGYLSRGIDLLLNYFALMTLMSQNGIFALQGVKSSVSDWQPQWRFRGLWSRRFKTWVIFRCLFLFLQIRHRAYCFGINPLIGSPYFQCNQAISKDFQAFTQPTRKMKLYKSKLL